MQLAGEGREKASGTGASEGGGESSEDTAC